MVTDSLGMRGDRWYNYLVLGAIEPCVFNPVNEDKLVVVLLAIVSVGLHAFKVIVSFLYLD